MKHTKKFGKYTATLELDGDSSYCDVESATGAASSLALASDLGFLEGKHGSEEPIPPAVVDAIENWAISLGW